MTTTAARRRRPAAFAQALQHHRAGRLEEAVALYRRALGETPEDAEAHNLMGVALGQLGRAGEAIEALRTAVRLARRDPTFLYNLGLAYQQAGRHEEAVIAFERALRARADHLEALKALGGSLLALGRLEDAEDACRRALRRAAADGEVWANAAAVALARGRVEEALERARKGAALAPRSATAQANLGAALLASGDAAAAETALEEALVLRPGHAEARNSLGLALLALGRVNEALAAFEAALAARPRYLQAGLNLARTLRELSLFTDAQQAYRRVLEMDPDNRTALYGLGETLIDAGAVEAAAACHDAILAREPGSARALARKALLLDMMGESEAGLRLAEEALGDGLGGADLLAAWGRLARRFGRAAEAVERLEGALGEERLSTPERRLLHFVLAQLHDDLEHWDRAFAHAETGNRLREAGFDPDAFSASVDALIGFFDAGRERTAARAANRCERPVFIVGMPRSGTSLVEQIVASHPQVRGGGERDDIPRIVRELVVGAEGAHFPELLEGLDRDLLDALAAQQLARIDARADGAARLTDKLPYNFLNLGLIARLFPRARVIHCRRDPLDTCLSCYFQLFARGNLQTYDLGHLGRYWRDYERLMAHWSETLELAVTEVRYEDLVADTEAESRRLIDFLGLPWDERCLRFYENPRLVNTASYDQVRRPVYHGAVGRWRHYEAHLEPLRQALAGA